MDKRIAKIIIGKDGGTASKNALTYKISLPSSWINELKITPENREVIISFNGEKITIERQS